MRVRVLYGLLQTDTKTGKSGAPSPDHYDAYLITGGKYSVFDRYPWQERLFAFLQSVISIRQPIAGICYGHQAIAHVLGATVIRSPKGYGVGLMPVKVIGDRPWCQTRRQPYWLHAMHQDQLIDLPDNAECFLSSDFCPLSGFTIGKNVFAIQQHPDFTKSINQDLIERRREKMGHEVAQAGIDSLAGRDDTNVSIDWLARFFLEA